VPAALELEPLCQRVPDAVFGLGPVAATLDEIAPAAAQGRRALEVGRRLDPEQRVHSDADVGVFATLSREPAAVQRFIDRVLGPLDGQRPARAEEMLATLEALIDTRSVGEAAGRLGVHRHTVVYRMARLKQLGVDVDDPAQRNRIWLALRCRRLLQA
jgi:DNA-binding PucR family transcriptional regulator